MCGRFISGTGRVSWRQFSQLLEFPEPDDPPPPEDIYPSHAAPVVRNNPEGGGNELVMLEFGLFPSWASDPKQVRSLFNVRSETARRKFGKLFKHRRCVVPTGGFYEWGPKPKGETRKPMYLLDDDARGYAPLAGLWTGHRGGPPYTFAILTTEPGSDELRGIHHRMPVILTDEQAQQWLDPDADPDALEAFTAPWTSPLLVEKVS
jgi:putative SOS response-associated peptidase YedK